MVIDLFYIMVLIFAVTKGLSKGFVLGIFSLLAFIIGLAAALKLSAIVGNMLGHDGSESKKWLPVISFLLVFFIVVFIVNIGAKIIQKTIRLSMLGWIDRIGGIALYLILNTIIFSVLLFFVTKVGIFSPETVAQSKVYDYVSPWGPKVIDNLGKIIPIFKGLFNDLQIFFEQLGTKIQH